jgi:hypothetical protein
MMNHSQGVRKKLADASSSARQKIFGGEKIMMAALGATMG